MTIRVRKYIALILLLLFGITLLPVNALHHHPEDAHATAVRLHDTSHACSLDADYCQNDGISECDHDNHLRARIPHCFSCKYSFVKQFCLYAGSHPAPVAFVSFRFSLCPLGDTENIRFSTQNKGPPAHLSVSA